MVLASYGDEHGRNIFPSQETLAKVCRRSVRHVRGKLRELTELGLLRRLSHGGGRPSHRNGRRRRVTPARYELTLPLWLAASEERASQARNASPRPGRPSPRPRGGPAAQRPGDGSAHTNDGALSARAVEKVKSALGTPTLSETQCNAVVAAAVARAPGEVSNRLAYALAVIRSDPASFRPTPDVREPACPRHPQQPTTRCQECAAARADPPSAWRQMRAKLRQGRGR